MDSFPPKIEHLLDEARSAHDPSAADRERLLGAIAVGLGKAPSSVGAPEAVDGATTQAAAGAAGSSAAATVGTAVVLKWLAIVAVIGGVGSMVAYNAQQSSVGPEPSAAPAEAVGPTMAAPPAAEHEQQPTTQLAVEPPPAAVPAEAGTAAPVGNSLPSRPAASTALTGNRVRVKARARRPGDLRQAAIGARDPDPATTPPAAPALDEPVLESEPEEVAATEPAVIKPGSDLAAELGLIRAASRALRDKQPLSAMERLQQHSSRFPRGSLVQERKGLRALTLCELGRFTEGRAAKRSFLKQAGDSPMAARVKAACVQVDRR